MQIALVVIGALGLATILPFTIYCTYLRLASSKIKKCDAEDLINLAPAYLSCILLACLFFLDASLQVWVFWMFLYFALAAFPFRNAYWSLRTFEQTRQSTFKCILITYLTVMVLCYSFEVLCVAGDMSKVFKPVIIVQELCWLLLSAGSIYLFLKLDKEIMKRILVTGPSPTKSIWYNKLFLAYAVQLVCQVAFVIVTIVDEFPFGSINSGFIIMTCILMAFVIVIQIS